MLKKYLIPQLFFAITLGVLLLFSLSSYARTELPPLNFEVIPIHNTLLKKRAYIWQEHEGYTSFKLEKSASAGDKVITLSEETEFNASELIVYRSASDQFYVTQVETVNGNTITLTEPLKEDVDEGENLWNFYNDASHPNDAGYKALADFALRRIGFNSLDNKTHAFIGDSWLASKTLEERLASQINMIEQFNKAVGGRTSIDVLDAFDEDFSDRDSAFDYVWITLGTNDYWLDVSAEDFIQNIERVIRKANNLGAKVIIFDSSVGPLEWDDSSNSFKSIRKDLSDAYSKNLAELYNKNQSGGRSGGSVFLLDLIVVFSTAIFIRRRRLSFLGISE